MAISKIIISMAYSKTIISVAYSKTIISVAYSKTNYVYFSRHTKHYLEHNIIVPFTTFDTNK